MPDPSSPLTPQDGLSETEQNLKTIQQARANVVSNAIKKTAIGATIGAVLSVGMFRRRVWPIVFSTGFALGLAYEQGNQLLQAADELVLERIRTKAEHTSVPPGMS